MQWFKNNPGIWHVLKEIIDLDINPQLVRAKCGNMGWPESIEDQVTDNDLTCSRCARAIARETD